MDMLEIIIDSQDSLIHAFDVLHDATCENNEIKYDVEKGTLDIFFNRELFEDLSKMKSHRVFFFLYRWEFPIVKSQLHLENLSSCKINLNKMSPGGDMFNECKILDDNYDLIFCMGLNIEINFKKNIKGYLKDLMFIENKQGSILSFRAKPKV